MPALVHGPAPAGWEEHTSLGGTPPGTYWWSEEIYDTTQLDPGGAVEGNLFRYGFNCYFDSGVGRLIQRAWRLGKSSTPNSTSPLEFYLQRIISPPGPATVVDGGGSVTCVPFLAKTSIYEKPVCGRDPPRGRAPDPGLQPDRPPPWR